LKITIAHAAIMLVLIGAAVAVPIAEAGEPLPAPTPASSPPPVTQLASPNSAQRTNVAVAARAQSGASFDGYVDPFRLSSNLVTGRVDQGVDFTGSGLITAIGEATILAIEAPGWPEGGGVLYRLLKGPLEGQQIYVYEGVEAEVQAGQTVKAGEQIAIFRPGGSIETGFANAAGVPLGHGEYDEGKITRYGLQMLSLLQRIGIGRDQPRSRADRH
jgi:hypothetical protein